LRPTHLIPPPGVLAEPPPAPHPPMLPQLASGISSRTASRGRGPSGAAQAGSRALSVGSRTHEPAHLQPHLTPGQNAITDGHKGDRGQRQDQGWRAEAESDFIAAILAVRGRNLPVAVGCPRCGQAWFGVCLPVAIRLRYRPDTMTKSSTILITGAAGEIGSRLARRLHQQGHQVRALVCPGIRWWTASRIRPRCISAM
jgi:hypothetical protein